MRLRLLLCLLLAPGLGCHDEEPSPVVPDDPRMACVLGSIELPGIALVSAVSNGHAYVFVLQHGLFVVDLQDPTALHQVAAVVLEDADELLIHDHHLVAVGQAGLRIFDIQDPSDPRRIGAVDMQAASVAVEAAQLFVGGVLEDVVGLFVFDISTPATPQRIGSLAMDVYPTALALSGTQVFAGGDGFSVIDIQDASQPQLVSSTQMPGYLHAVRVRDDKAFVFSYQTPRSAWYSGNDALWVLDLASPLTPTFSSVLTLGTNLSLQLCLEGSWAFVARGTQAIQVLDLAYADSPQIARTVLVPQRAMGLSLTDEVLVVSDDGGLHLLDRSCAWDTGVAPD